jgi:hypothetical protein
MISDQATLATPMQRPSLGTTANSMPRAVAKSDLMILFLHEDLSNLFRHRVFSERFTLRNAFAVIANGLVFIIEIKTEHVFRIFRCAYRFGGD